jgi:hypothetical protein
VADLDVDQIRAAHAAATRGPWRWTGDTDYHDIRLVGSSVAAGDVLATLGRERKVDDRATRSYAVMVGESYVSDGNGGWRDKTDEEIAEQVEDEFLVDSVHGVPREDTVLAVFDPEVGVYRHARDLAVFEVGRNRGLPDDTPDTDERIYRRDVVDVRNPNARFLRDSWAYVDWLLRENDLLNAEAEADRALVTVCDHCLKASCWHMEFPCENYQNAGTVDLPVLALKTLGREHSDYWVERTFTPTVRAVADA